MMNVDIVIQALADRTRLRALVLLRREGPLCVCELTEALDVSQPKMSRHLAALRTLGVVEDSRVANRVFYRLRPDLPGWARGLVDRVAEGVTAAPGFKVIAERLERMPGRPAERPAFGWAPREAGEQDTADAV
jgi:ArsR family transcriptional regulator, arsenate/arsenite/antimonite-responsive transcriptional repressor